MPDDPNGCNPSGQRPVDISFGLTYLPTQPACPTRPDHQRLRIQSLCISACLPSSTQPFCLTRHRRHHLLLLLLLWIINRNPDTLALAPPLVLSRPRPPRPHLPAIHPSPPTKIWRRPKSSTTMLVHVAPPPTDGLSRSGRADFSEADASQPSPDYEFTSFNTVSLYKTNLSWLHRVSSHPVFVCRSLHSTSPPRAIRLC